MTAEVEVLTGLVLAVALAFVGGMLARRLGQPAILGYLLAGVIVGPFTPGPVADARTIPVLAEVGVALLMFSLGAEFSLGELRALGRVVTLGGPLQIALTIALGPLLAPLLGLSPAQGVFLGGLIALSSTVVVLKALLARDEARSRHGRVALGILIAQDLAVVPLVVALPALAGGGAHLLPDLGLAALKAAGVLGGAYLVGARAVPWLLGHVARSGTRELFVLGVVALALGTALVTQLAGLSLAFGAFLAGLVVAESDYRARVASEVLPLRDLFAALFFVSVGMLINPQGLLDQAGLLLPLVAAVVVGKAAIAIGVLWLLGTSPRVAILAGLGLAQVGEFSFVLASVGVADGVIPARLFDLTLALALVTIVLTPALLALGPLVVRLLERAGVRIAPAADLDALGPGVAGLRDHVVIGGGGRVGRELAGVLDGRRVPYLIVDDDPAAVAELRGRGSPVVYGDVANPAVLAHANLADAALLAILVPDPAAVELATRHARQARGPGLDIVARVADADQVGRLRRAGADEVVQPEFEAGVEVIRHVLRRFAVAEGDLDRVIAERREAVYHAAAGHPQ